MCEFEYVHVCVCVSLWLLVTGHCLTFVGGFEHTPHMHTHLPPPLLPSRGNKSSLILPDQGCCPPQLYQPVN